MTSRTTVQYSTTVTANTTTSVTTTTTTTTTATTPEPTTESTTEATTEPTTWTESSTTPAEDNMMKVAVAVGVTLGILAIAVILFIVWTRVRKNRNQSSPLEIITTKFRDCCTSCGVLSGLPKPVQDEYLTTDEQNRPHCSHLYGNTGSQQVIIQLQGENPPENEYADPNRNSQIYDYADVDNDGSVNGGAVASVTTHQYNTINKNQITTTDDKDRIYLPLEDDQDLNRPVGAEAASDDVYVPMEFPEDRKYVDHKNPVRNINGKYMDMGGTRYNAGVKSNQKNVNKPMNQTYINEQDIAHSNHGYVNTSPEVRSRNSDVYEYALPDRRMQIDPDTVQ